MRAADRHRRHRPPRIVPGRFHYDHWDIAGCADQFLADLDGARRTTTVGLDELCFRLSLIHI